MARTDGFFGKGSQVGSIKWPDPDLGPWRVQIAWRVVRGVPTPVGMMLRLTDAVTAADDMGVDAPHKIDGGVLRQLPVANLAEQTRRQLVAGNRKSADMWAQFADHADGSEREDEQAQVRSSVSFAEALDSPASPRALGDAHYEKVARIYRAHAHPGGTPTKAVSEAFYISKSAAAKQVARARERGLLAPSSGRGRKS